MVRTNGGIIGTCILVLLTWYCMHLVFPSKFPSTAGKRILAMLATRHSFSLDEGKQSISGLGAACLNSHVYCS